MKKFTAEKQEICLMCGAEIQKGSFAYEHDKDYMDISCEDCYREYLQDTI